MTQLRNACVNDRITALNEHKYGEFVEYLTGQKTDVGHRQNKSPVPVPVCHHKPLHRLRRDLNGASSDEKPEIKHLSHGSVSRS